MTAHPAAVHHVMTATENRAHVEREMADYEDAVRAVKQARYDAFTVAIEATTQYLLRPTPTPEGK